MKRLRYTAAQKRRALALAERVGPEAAARKLGLRASVIYYWRKGGRHAAHTNLTGGDTDAQQDQLVAFIFGETRARLSGYAEGAGIPAEALFARVGKLLTTQAKRGRPFYAQD
jgi:hypothetical protein